MAYKFQRGAAVFSGSLVQTTNVESDGDNVLSDQDLVAAGAGAQVLAGDDVVAMKGGLQITSTNSHGSSLQAGKVVMSSSADRYASVSIKDSSNNTLLKMGCASTAAEGTLGDGFLGVYNTAGSALSFFSGSGTGFCATLQVGDDAEVAGNLVVAGDLTVEGSLTDLQVQNLIVEDDKAQIASGASSLAASIDSGFTIGSAAQRGQLMYKSASFDAEVSEQSYFGIFGENVATGDYINVSASTYYGDGSNLSGVTSAGSFSVSLKAGGDTLVEGLNYITASGASQTVTMLNSDTVGVGTVVKVKSYGNHSATNKIIIQRAGDDTIEGGAANIELESAFASITLVKTAANTWNII